MPAVQRGAARSNAEQCFPAAPLPRTAPLPPPLPGPGSRQRAGWESGAFAFILRAKGKKSKTGNFPDRHRGFKRAPGGTPPPQQEKRRGRERGDSGAGKEPTRLGVRRAAAEPEPSPAQPSPGAGDAGRPGRLWTPILRSGAVRSACSLPWNMVRGGVGRELRRRLRGHGGGALSPMVSAAHGAPRRGARGAGAAGRDSAAPRRPPALGGRGAVRGGCGTAGLGFSHGASAAGR